MDKRIDRNRPARAFITIGIRCDDVLTDRRRATSFIHKLSGASQFFYSGLKPMDVVHEWLGGTRTMGPAVLALGNFDGLGVDHTRVISQAASIARDLHLPCGVLTFEPHPMRWLHPETPHFSLLTAHQAERILRKLGVDRVYMLLFNEALAKLTHDEFAREVLSDRLGVTHIVVGDDFRYGRDRGGSPQSMSESGRAHGFAVTVVPSLGTSFGPARARQAIKDGAPGEAVRMLGRPYSIEGPVIQGARLGRTIGFPTANIPLGDYVRPRYGIYASISHLPWGPPMPGVAYIGRRPTVGGGEEYLEVNLFDFSDDIYGKVLSTDLITFIREDETFPNLATMKDQIGRDCEYARSMLNEWMRRAA